MGMQDLLDVVDENDNVIKTVAKRFCYDNKLRPRIVSIAVIDPQDRRIAIQTRAKDAWWQPEYYCLSSVGHVDAGEEWDVAASRELVEEMGLQTQLRFLAKFPFIDEFGDPFMMGLYFTEASKEDIRPSAKEVSEVFWMNKEEVAALLQRGEMIHNLLPPAIPYLLPLLA